MRLNIFDLRFGGTNGTSGLGDILYTIDNDGNEFLTTDNIREGSSRLYYSDQRVNDNPNVQKGVEAYNWGDHATSGYLDDDTFDQATTGINQELQRLDNEKLNISDYNDYATAGLVSQDEFDQSTSGINTNLTRLENEKLDKNQYNDYTTAGLVYKSEFDQATTGINESLDDIQIIIMGNR
jgi:hypothetical protein